jgi:hypothetical protein
MASTEPCTSPLMTSGNSLRRPETLSWLIICSSEPRAAAGDGLCRALALAVFGDLAGAGFVFDDREAVAGLRRALKPSTSTGIDGPASLTCSPLSLTSARTRPHSAPATTMSPASACRAAPARWRPGRDPIELGFDDGAFGRAVRIGLQVEHFGLQQDGFEQLVEAGAFLSPTLRRRAFAAHRFDEHFVLQQLGADALRIGVGLSILLIATMIGTPAALACLMDSIVCGITPSSAATTRMAMSVACAPRARMAVNAAWPGVSMKVIFRRSSRPDRRRYAG